MNRLNMAMVNDMNGMVHERLHGMNDERKMNDGVHESMNNGRYCFYLMFARRLRHLHVASGE